jgi:hypothetical protein
MQLLENANQELKPYLELVQLFTKLRSDKPDAEAVVQALLAYANDPTQGDVATIVAALHLDGTKIQNWVNGHKDQLSFLAANVGDLAGTVLSWSLDKKGNVAAGAFTISLDANASATISGDDDGDLFDDGSVTYDKTKSAYLTFTVDGKVSAGTNVPSLPIQSLIASGAFSANASILAGAYFEHPVSTPVIDAIISDVPRFRLPLDLAPLAPGQCLRLNGQGSVALSGSLSWGKTIVSTGAVSSDALNLQAVPIEADVQLGASVSFQAAMQGLFNIVVSAADDGRRRVQLVRSRTLSGGTTLQAGVGVTIKGIDKVANALVSQITTPLQPLVTILTKDLNQFGQLHDLFTKDLNAQVDNLVNNANVINEIQAWLTKIGSDADLKAKFEEIIVNAVDAKAALLIQNMTNNLQPVVELAQKLIKNYQSALAKVNDAVKAAAEVKLGIALSRKQTTTDTNKVALSIVIDPQKQPDAYLHLLYGDFTQALDLARANDPSVTLENATWTEKGSTTIATSLSVSAFGNNVAVGSLLQQDWQWQLSASGDLTLGVTSSLQSYQRDWRVLRSVTFLADTQVLATISSANQLVDPAVHTKATIDVSEESQKFTRTDLGNWQNRMISIRVLSAATTMLDDAAIDPNNPGAKFPYGDLTRTAAIELTDDQVLTMAKANSFTARRTFAKAFVDFVSNTAPLNIVDANETPIAAWQSVQAWALGGSTQFPSSLDFADDSGKKHNAGGNLALLNRVAMSIGTFDKIISELRDLATHNSLAGATIDVALATIRTEQRRILNGVGEILASLLIDREQIGFALFMTMWNLAGGQSAVDPFVVLVRDAGQNGQEKRWVYA